MPTTETRIKFFDLKKCGYYKRRVAQPRFGHCSAVLEDLKNWVDGKSIAETATYTPGDEQDNGLLRTFCLDIRKQGESYLLTTWNETPTLDGGIASIELGGEIGDAKVETAELSNGFVPGYPSYFWFPGESEHLVTVQINSRLNGRANLDLYMKEYLRKYSCFTVLEEVENQAKEYVEKVIGYSKTGKKSDIEDKHLTPKFECKQSTKRGNLDYLRAYVANIRKIIRKDSIQLSIPEKLRWWQSLTRVFTDDNKSLSGSEEHKVRIELEFEPTLEELNSMIREWESNDEASSSDVGVLFNDEPGKVYWFSKAIASELVELDLRFTRPPVADTERLLNKLEQMRTNIIAILSE